MVWIFVALTVALWGGAPIIDKIALGSNKIDPAIGVLIRGITAAVVMGGVVAATGRAKELGSLDLRTAALFMVSALLAAALGQWTYFQALKLGKASQVVPLCGTFPVVAALLGFLVLRERVTLERVAGILLVVVGIWLVRR
ncbi:MAG: EamA family transporter [Armatimonadetes bacterium]|nr:EamA family transporter [Armatimonadota bacterium]